MDEQVFEIIKNALDLVFSKSYELLPVLEKATIIIAYILSFLLFALFFAIPTIIIICIIKNCWNYTDNNDNYKLTSYKKRRR